MESATQSLIKGMRSLDFKNTVVDLHSKKKTWKDIGIPESILFNLKDLQMDKPSIIQAQAIPMINSAAENYLFQAINGSGKTLAFGLPSIMRVDPSNPDIQVIIFANTRELIR
jgi:ATP-dependent RNA helicase DeaD